MTPPPPPPLRRPRAERRAPSTRVRSSRPPFRRRLAAVFLAVATAVPAVPAFAQQSTVPLATVAPPTRYADVIARARRLVVDTMRALGAPGASIAVAVDGQIVWSEGFGFADLEQRVPATPLTRFRIGSVSKSLTAGALAELVEEGKLDLDAPIQRYVPSFPRKRWEITTRELAGHTAGIRHYRGDEFLIQRHYPSVLAGLAIFENDSLLFQPGTRFSYSSYGWNLISAAIERASGEDFIGYMQRHVFAPSGMIHTVAEFEDSLIPFRARFYTRPPLDTTRPRRYGAVENAPYVDNSYKWAGGGFLSTAEDLARYGSAWTHPGFLSAATERLFMTSQRTTDGKETGYGMGWFVGTDSAGRRVAWHSGGSVGGTAFLVVYPDQHVVVALLTNTDVTFVGIARGIAKSFVEDPRITDR